MPPRKEVPYVVYLVFYQWLPHLIMSHEMENIPSAIAFFAFYDNFAKTSPTRLHFLQIFVPTNCPLGSFGSHLQKNANLRGIYVF